MVGRENVEGHSDEPLKNRWTKMIKVTVTVRTNQSVGPEEIREDEEVGQVNEVERRVNEISLNFGAN